MIIALFIGSVVAKRDKDAVLIYGGQFEPSQKRFHSLEGKGHLERRTNPYLNYLIRFIVSKK